MAQSEGILSVPFRGVGEAQKSRIARLERLAWKKPLGTISLIVLVAVWVVCFLSPMIAPYNYSTLFVGPKLAGPSSSYLFGTDQIGRDLLSRILWGGRMTLALSAIATAMGMVLAVLMGLTSGYFLGVFDLIFQRISDAIQALPGLVVLLVIAALFGGDRVVVLTTVAVLFAPGVGRLFRAEALRVRNEVYVEAARAMGASHLRIMTRHVLPNVVSLIIVVGTVFIGYNILLLASLSFLGIINAEYPDWGTLLNTAAAQYMVQGPWLVVFPAAAITITVLAYNLLGDALRDILDPRLRQG